MASPKKATSTFCALATAAPTNRMIFILFIYFQLKCIFQSSRVVSRLQLMASLLISALVTSCVSVPLPKVTTIRGKPGAPRVAMPSVALGNAGGCHPDPNGNEATDPTCPAYNVVLSAIDVGYRSFHDALSYSNQAGLGAALKEAMTGARQVPRADLFAMSMVPKYLMGYNLTKRAVHASLQQLELAYIDLVMVHHRAADVTDWPRTVSTMHAFPADFVYPRNPVVNGSKSQWFTPPCALADGTWTQCQDETWRALIEMRDAGLIRAIGVSNWQVSNLARMKAMGYELPAVNQIEVRKRKERGRERRGVGIAARCPLCCRAFSTYVAHPPCSSLHLPPIFLQ